MNVGLYRRGVF